LQNLGVHVKRVFLGSTLLFCSAVITALAENYTNQVPTSRLAFINIPKVLEESHSTLEEITQSIHLSTSDPNLIVLTDGVIYADEKLDLTQNFISDGHSISNNTQKQLNEIPMNSKIGWVNIPKLLEKIPEHENAKKKLQAEFPGNDSVTFSEKFNIRRNEELKGIQTLIINAVRNMAKTKGFDVILTDGVIYAGKSSDMTGEIIQVVVGENKFTGRDTLQTQEVPSFNTSSTPLHGEEFSKLEAACLSIGFKKGTEQFGDCVLELKNRVKQVK
jgi:Skp family chaperone for outer membrane proteins